MRVRVGELVAGARLTHTTWLQYAQRVWTQVQFART
jgi:hypothetical protein